MILIAAAVFILFACLLTWIDAKLDDAMWEETRDEGFF